MPARGEPQFDPLPQVERVRWRRNAAVQFGAGSLQSEVARVEDDVIGRGAHDGDAQVHRDGPGLSLGGGHGERPAVRGEVRRRAQHRKQWVDILP